MVAVSATATSGLKVIILPGFSNPFGIVALLGQQLHVVGAIAPAALHIINMRIGDEYADLAAERRSCR